MPRDDTGRRCIRAEGQRALSVPGHSRADYDRLVETGEPLPDFMRRSPLAEAEDLEFPRDRSPGREVPL